MCQSFLVVLTSWTSVINTLFHPVTLGHGCKQSKFKLENCQALAWWPLFSCPGSFHPVNCVVYFFILPAWPLGNVLNELFAVASLFDSHGNMGCNNDSINFKGSNVSGGQVIPLMQSIKTDLAFAWSSCQLVTIAIECCLPWQVIVLSRIILMALDVVWYYHYVVLFHHLLCNLKQIIVGGQGASKVMMTPLLNSANECLIVN